MRALPSSVSLSALLLSLAGLGCFACSSADAAPSASSGGPSPVGGSAGAAPNDGSRPTSLEFEMTSSTLAAREQVTLNVRALPPRSYSIRFGLPTSGGDPLDAVLDRSSSMTDDNGVTSVVLTAPSSPTTFELRASVDDRVATLPLMVTDRGLATLEVDPSYPSTLRDITTWVATAHVDKSCADVPGMPPADGELKAPLAGKGEAPVIGRVPAGTRLAVTLRSGHFVGGCTSVEMLPPGPVDSRQIVKVTVLDRPIDLSASSLAFSLDLQPAEQTFSGLLAAAGTEALDAMLGTDADDVGALLNAMRREAGDSAQLFQNTRSAEGWDAQLRSRFGQGASSKLRDVLRPWLLAGRQSFAAAEHPFSGSLVPLSEPKNADASSSALLTMQKVGGLDAASAGFVDGARASWSASADDSVVLSSDVYFARSQLAFALAEAAALGQPAAMGADNGADALALAIDCEGIGEALAGAGSDTTLAYVDCDGACLAETCSAAIAALWARGEGASGVDYSRLNFSATGSANVGEAAEITGFAGTWLGELSDSIGTHETGGAITAGATTPAP